MGIVSFNPQIGNSECDLLFPPQKELLPILEFLNLIFEIKNINFKMKCAFPSNRLDYLIDLMRFKPKF